MTDIIVKDVKNGSEYYYGGGASYTAGNGIDINNNEISADMSTAVYDNTTSGMTADNVQDAIDEVFQSVSNGKELIADAITDKGVSTSATDSFQTMASNIESLTVGGKYVSNSLGDVIYYTSLGSDLGTNTGYKVKNTTEDGDDVYYLLATVQTYKKGVCLRYNQTKGEIKYITFSGANFTSSTLNITVDSTTNSVNFGQNNSTERSVAKYDKTLGEFVLGTNFKIDSAASTSWNTYNSHDGGDCTSAGFQLGDKEVFIVGRKISGVATHILCIV